MKSLIKLVLNILAIWEALVFFELSSKRFARFGRLPERGFESQVPDEL